MQVSGRNMFGGPARPRTASMSYRPGQARPHPTISRGFGGATVTLAPRQSKSVERPKSSGTYRK